MVRNPATFGGSLSGLARPSRTHVLATPLQDVHWLRIYPRRLPGYLHREVSGEVNLTVHPSLRGCWAYLELASAQYAHCILCKLGLNHDDQLRVFAYAKTSGLYIPELFAVLDITILRPSLATAAQLRWLIECADHFFVADRRSCRYEFLELLNLTAAAAC